MLIVKQFEFSNQQESENFKSLLTTMDLHKEFYTKLKEHK